MKASYDVPAVRHAIRVIEVLCESNQPLGVSEICRMVELNKNMVFRILNTLQEQGWVYQEEPGPKYSISLIPYRITSKPINRLSVNNAAVQPVKKLWEDTGESVYLAIIHENSALYIQHFESVKNVRIAAMIGGMYPLQCTAPGKVLLAFSKEQLINNVIRDKGLIKYTENTITDIEAFYEQLSIIRENGYAVDNEEFGKGIICFSAPIFDYSGEIVAAVGIAASTVLYDMGSLCKELGTKVILTAQNISLQLGYVQE